MSGGRGSTFPRPYQRLHQMYKLCSLALFKPRIRGVKADKVADSFSFDGAVRVDAIGFSGIIWCFGKRRLISIDVISISKYCAPLKVNPRSPHPWLLVVVYGSSQDHFCDELWAELCGIHAANDLP